MKYNTRCSIDNFWNNSITFIRNELMNDEKNSGISIIMMLYMLIMISILAIPFGLLFHASMIEYFWVKLRTSIRESTYNWTLKLILSNTIKSWLYLNILRLILIQYVEWDDKLHSLYSSDQCSLHILHEYKDSRAYKGNNLSIYVIYLLIIILFYAMNISSFYRIHKCLSVSLIT